MTFSIVRRFACAVAILALGVGLDTWLLSTGPAHVGSRLKVGVVRAVAHATCEIAGQGCSLHPCVEFIQAMPSRRTPHVRVLSPSRATCTRYPSDKGRPVLIGY